MASNAWAVHAVGYYRALGFFQSQVDSGEVDGEEPGFAHVEIGLPLPAYGKLTDGEAAEIILAHHLEGVREHLDGETDESADRTLVMYDVFRTLCWDTECVDPHSDTYVDALLAMARISRGAFAPSNIVETWETGDGPLRVAFTFRDRRIEWTLEVSWDWMDSSIVDRVNELIADTPYQFYVPESRGQDLFLVVLTLAEKRKLEAERGWKFSEALTRESTAAWAAAAEACNDLTRAIHAADVAAGEGDLGANLARYQGLLAQAGQLREARPELAAFCLATECYLHVMKAFTHVRANQVAEAKAAAHAARHTYMIVASVKPDLKEHLRIAAHGPTASYLLASLEFGEGDVTRPMSLCDEALADLEVAVLDPRYEQLALNVIGATHELRGEMFVGSGRIAEGLAAFQAARAAFMRMTVEAEDQPDHERRLGNVEERIVAATRASQGWRGWLSRRRKR